MCESKQVNLTKDGALTFEQANSEVSRGIQRGFPICSVQLTRISVRTFAAVKSKR